MYKNRIKIGIIFLSLCALVNILLSVKDNNTLVTEEYIEELIYKADNTQPYYNIISIMEKFTFMNEEEYIDLLASDADLVARLSYTGNSITTSSSKIYFEFNNLDTNELFNVEYTGYYDEADASAIGLPQRDNTYLMFLNECSQEMSKKISNCYIVRTNTIDIDADNRMTVGRQLKVFDITTGFNPVDATTEISLSTTTLKEIRDKNYTFMFTNNMSESVYTIDEFYNRYQAIYDVVTTRYSV